MKLAMRTILGGSHSALSVSAVLTALALASACTDDGGTPPAGDGITDEGISSIGDDDMGDDADDDDGDDNGTTGMDKLDMPEEEGEGMLPCGEGEFCDCEIPPHTPCDAAANASPDNVIGINCPGELSVISSTAGSTQAIGNRNSFGNLGAFPPQEGSQYLVLGSGVVAELDDSDPFSGACSSDLDLDFSGAFDPGTLPSPMVGMDVGAQDCTENPALIGMGDCSNTIAAQLSGTVNDYTELRMVVDVPLTVNSFSYNLAFFSYEYPNYYQSVFNDMYIGWLNSEVWTGNISFDGNGAPISLNAGFLDYRDAGTDTDPMCPAAAPCTAPELHGTCMQGHAGTAWLTSTAGVNPGETATIVFGIFDMSDSVLDSYVFLDNFQWGCDGEAPPMTAPIE